MADIQDMRAQRREMRHQPAASGSGGNLTFYLMAGIAVAAGFGIVLFMPKVFFVQRTAALPAFHETVSRQAVPVQNAAPAQPARVSDYAGKSPDEVAPIADAVCARTAQARPNGSPARQNASFSPTSAVSSGHTSVFNELGSRFGTTFWRVARGMRRRSGRRRPRRSSRIA